MGGELLEDHDRLLIYPTKVGDIAFIEGLRVVGQHDAAIVGYGGDRHASAIPPDQFLLFFGRAISLLLIGAALDAESAIRITGKDVAFVVALWDIGAPIVLFDPSVNVLDINGDDFA
jgi:hypothetical protein